MLLLSGCGGSPSNAAATASGPVARVGNDVIPASLFELRVSKTLAGIRQGGGPAQGSSGYGAMVNQVRASVMRSLIIDTVIAHEASFRGLAATDADVERELASDARAAGGMDKLRQQLAGDGGSLDQRRDELRAHLNEQRLEDLFARQRAAEIAARLNQNADFATLAAQLSDDVATRAAGGALGVLSAGQLHAGDPAFSAAVTALPAGHTTSAPVRDDAGYELIRVDAVAVAGPSARHILVAAPRVYRVADRPAWFSESILEAVAQDCSHNAITVYINAGQQPCAAVASATASPSAAAALSPSP
jgi:hypothetical protein